MKWTVWAQLLGLILLGAVAHHFQPVAVDVFIVVMLVIVVWQVIDSKFMSRERRAEIVAKFKKRHGIPQGQPHGIDSILRK